MSDTSDTFRPVLYQPAIQLPAPYPDATNFPLALAPAPDANLANIVAAIQRVSKDGTLRKHLDQHGAIYFKGLGLEGAEEFSRFAHAFGWTPHEDIGNPVRRTVHAKNVATANEGPNTQPVYPHNEFGLSPHYPAYVLFFCASPPDTGGETPINNSIILYQRLKKKHPEFIDIVEEKGVKYQLFYPNTARDQTSSAGTSVLQAYGQHVLDTDDVETVRRKIEQEVQRLHTATWVWENRTQKNPLGDLRVWQKLPAVRTHEQTGLPAFFNNIVSRFLNAKNAETLTPPHINDQGDYQPPAFYGDGGLIPQEYLESAVEIIKETRSLISWQKGDVILLDNHAIQHAREPWTGKRKLLASLWDDPETAAAAA